MKNSTHLLLCKNGEKKSLELNAIDTRKKKKKGETNTKGCTSDNLLARSLATAY